jgi:hypothetical protein
VADKNNERRTTMRDQKIESALKKRQIEFVRTVDCACPGCYAHDTARCNSYSEFWVQIKKIDGTYAKAIQMCSACAVHFLPEEKTT